MQRKHMTTMPEADWGLSVPTWAEFHQREEGQIGVDAMPANDIRSSNEMQATAKYPGLKRAPLSKYRRTGTPAASAEAPTI